MASFPITALKVLLKDALRVAGARDPGADESFNSHNYPAIAERQSESHNLIPSSPTLPQIIVERNNAIPLLYMLTTQSLPSLSRRMLHQKKAPSLILKSFSLYPAMHPLVGVLLGIFGHDLDANAKSSTEKPPAQVSSSHLKSHPDYRLQRYLLHDTVATTAVREQCNLRCDIAERASAVTLSE